MIPDPPDEHQGPPLREPPRPKEDDSLLDEEGRRAPDDAVRDDEGAVHRREAEGVEEDDGLPTLHRASAPPRDYLRWGAALLAGIAILGIVLVSFTDIAAVFLPMDQRYLNVLIPETEDGSEPFILNELSNILEENHLSVSGRITNASREPVENVVAVISATETTGRFPEVVEVPVQPSPLEPGQSGTFSMSVTLRQKPNSYTVRFKIENGPFVPHRDERGLGFEFAPGD